MKGSKASLYRKTHRIPDLRFEDQRLTSFAGLILFQSLFTRIGLKAKLSNCFGHLKANPIYGHGFTVMLLIVHLLQGYRQLRDLSYYRDDPAVQRLLGVERLPDVATLSRSLAGMDSLSVQKLCRLSQQQVLQRIQALGLVRITLDFDGSVLSTSRFAEGMAVGFNRRKNDTAVIIRCFAPSPRLARPSMSGTDRVMCTIPMAPRPLSRPVSKTFGQSRRG